MKKFEELAEKMTASEEIFKGVILNVYRDTVELPDGKTSYREIIRHVGAVGVLPLTDEGNVIVERQYRYPLDEVITEIPAGKLDSKQEDRLDAAKRELREETGITADEWIDMGVYVPTCAYSDERITLYLARGLHKGEQKLDAGEFLNVEEVPLAQLIDEVMRGEITDGKTQTAILKAARIVGI